MLGDIFFLVSRELLITAIDHAGARKQLESSLLFLRKGHLSEGGENKA